MNWAPTYYSASYSSGSLVFLRFLTTSTSDEVKTGGGTAVGVAGFCFGFFASRLGACPLGMVNSPLQNLQIASGRV